MSYIPSEPVVILTATDAHMLWQAAKLNDLRIKHRGDQRLYDLLVSIYKVGLLEIAERGSTPRQTSASEEHETWTTQHIAKAAGIAERTVRLDCQNGTLPATRTRPNGPWSITATDAATYLTWRKKN